MSRSAGLALATAIVLGCVAFVVFDAAWVGDMDDGWDLDARDRPVLHGLGIALGVASLVALAWALLTLVRLLRAAERGLAVAGTLLVAIGGAAGLVVAAFQVYLLVVLGPTSEKEGEFFTTFLRVNSLQDRYLTVLGVALIALLAALSALAYGAARNGHGSRVAGWAVSLLPIACFLVPWLLLAYVAAVFFFAVSLIRATDPRVPGPQPA